MSTRTEGAGARVLLQVARDGVQKVKLIVIAPAPGKEPRVEGDDMAVQVKKIDEQRWALLLPELKAGKKELRLKF